MYTFATADCEEASDREVLFVESEGFWNLWKTVLACLLVNLNKKGCKGLELPPFAEEDEEDDEEEEFGAEVKILLR